MTFLDQPHAACRPHLRSRLHGPVERRAIAIPMPPQTLASVLLAPVDAVVGSRGWCLIAAMAFALLAGSQAWGQAAGGLKSDPVPKHNRARISAMERAKSEGLTKADLTPQWASFNDLRDYYGYQFEKLRDATLSAEYGKVMQGMLDDLDRTQRAKTPAAQHLVGWFVAGARAVALDNYHPAARVNATLLLAQIDDQGADLRAGKPPVPAQAALVPMVQLYRAGNSPDGVRAAALQGIWRHVMLGAVPQQYRQGIAGMMLQLAESEAPAGRSPEAHAYLQRYAVDILSVLANPNVTEKTTQTLVSLSTANEKPHLIAAYAAAKMGQLQPGKGKVQEPSKVLRSWAARAAAAVDGELDRIARLDPPKAVRDQPAMPTEQTRRPPGMGSLDGGMGMGMGMGYDGYGPSGPGYDSSSTMLDSSMDYSSMDMMGYGPGMGPGMYEGGMMMPRAKPQPVEVIAARRRINHVLQQLQVGVTGQATPGKPRQPAGLLVAATPQDQAAFDDWITTISDVVAAINVDTLDDRKKFVEALQEQSLVLKKLAGIDTAEAGALAPLDFNAMPAMNEFGEAPLDPAAGNVAPAAGNPPAARGGNPAPAGAAQPAGPGAPGVPAPGATGVPAPNGAPAAQPPAPVEPAGELDFSNQPDTALNP